MGRFDVFFERPDGGPGMVLVYVRVEAETLKSRSYRPCRGSSHRRSRIGITFLWLLGQCGPAVIKISSNVSRLAIGVYLRHHTRTRGIWQGVCCRWQHFGTSGRPVVLYLEDIMSASGG
jgi:hypothetical protein